MMIIKSCKYLLFFVENCCNLLSKKRFYDIKYTRVIIYMNGEDMNNTFLKNACDIIGKTEGGLTTTQIIEYTKGYAYEYNVEIPYPTMSEYKDKGCSNKRTALYENLLKFNDEQQCIIIKELCNLPQIKDDKQIIELKTKLLKLYGDNQQIYKYELETSIEEVKNWLDDYPKVKEKYNEAMLKLNNDIFERNILDDLRVSLELLLKEVLHNEKSLENQNKELSNYLIQNNNSQAVVTLYNAILNAYCTFQNNEVKHIKANNKDKNKNEIEFILETTNLLMKYLIKK